MAVVGNDVLDNVGRLKGMSIVFIIGSVRIINNDLIDTIKCINGVKDTGLTDTSEYGIIDDVDASINFNLLAKVYKSVTPLGKWYCRVQFEELQRSQKDKLLSMISANSTEMLLIVEVSEYLSMREVLKWNRLQVSKTACIVDLRYPRKEDLKRYLMKEFNYERIALTESQANELVFRIGSAYEEYRNIIDTLCTEIRAKYDVPDEVEKAAASIRKALGFNQEVLYHRDRIAVDDKEFKELVKKVSHFSLENLLCSLTAVSSSQVQCKGRPIYKIMDSLLAEMSATELNSRLRYKVEEMLWYRYFINKGIIPIITRYSASEVRSKLEGEYDNIKAVQRIIKASDFVLKRNAKIASLSPINDWYLMFAILESTGGTHNEQIAYRGLLELLNRRGVSNDRLLNNIGLKSTLSESLIGINKTHYRVTEGA